MSLESSEHTPEFDIPTSLSDRQLRTLQCLSDGMSQHEISLELGINQPATNNIVRSLKRFVERGTTPLIESRYTVNTLIIDGLRMGYLIPPVTPDEVSIYQHERIILEAICQGGNGQSLSKKFRHDQRKINSLIVGLRNVFDATNNYHLVSRFTAMKMQGKVIVLDNNG